MNEKRLLGALSLLALSSGPATMEGMEPAPGAVKLSRICVSLLVLLAAGIARAEEPAATLRDGYLVLPLVNKSNVPSLDWMASALAITAAEKLEALPNLRPVYGPKVLELVDTEEAGKRVPIGGIGGMRTEAVARRAFDLGARYLLAGSFSRPNWKAEISLELLEVVPPSATLPQASLRQVAATHGIAERNEVQTLLLDQLGKLIAEAGFRPDAEVQAIFKQPVIKDLYAFTLYGRAINQCFGVAGPKEPTKSLLVFKKMALIEPKFAEGHRMLGQCALELGDKARAISQLSYALDLKPGYYAALIALVRLYRARRQRGAHAGSRREGARGPALRRRGTPGLW